MAGSLDSGTAGIVDRVTRRVNPGKGNLPTSGIGESNSAIYSFQNFSQILLLHQSKSVVFVFDIFIFIFIFVVFVVFYILIIYTRNYDVKALLLLEFNSEAVNFFRRRSG